MGLLDKFKNLFTDEELIEEEKEIEKIDNKHDFYCYTRYDSFENDIDKVLYLIIPSTPINCAYLHISSKSITISKTIFFSFTNCFHYKILFYRPN